MQLSCKEDHVRLAHALDLQNWQAGFSGPLCSGKPWSLRKELEVECKGSPSGVVTRGGSVRGERGKHVYKKAPSHYEVNLDTLELS